MIFLKNKKLLQRVFFTVKVFISGGLFFFLASKVDGRELFSVLQGVQLEYIFLVIVLSFLNISVGTFRWYILLPEQYKISFATLLKIYITGIFFSFFLPAGIGAEVKKSFSIVKITKDKKSISTIVSDRLIGVFVLLILGVFLFPFFLDAFSYFFSYFFLTPLVIAFIFIGIIGVCVFLFFQKRDVLKKYFLPVSQKMFAINAFLALVSHALGALIYFLLFSAIGISVPFFLFLGAYFLILFLSLLPISINGIGIYESVYFFFFGSLLSPANILAVVLLGYLITLFYTLIGVYFFIQERSEESL